MEKCRAKVMHGFRLHCCSRKGWKDGYCKQHHPETVKARQEESDRKWEEQRKASPVYQLDRANKRIKELEGQLAELKKTCNCT